MCPILVEAQFLTDPSLNGIRKEQAEGILKSLFAFFNDHSQRKAQQHAAKAKTVVVVEVSAAIQEVSDEESRDEEAPQPGKDDLGEMILVAHRSSTRRIKKQAAAPAIPAVSPMEDVRATVAKRSGEGLSTAPAATLHALDEEAAEADAAAAFFVKPCV